MQENLKNDGLKIGKYEFKSRFILGSGKYSLGLIESAIEKAKIGIIMLASHRANTGEIANALDYTPKNIVLLPNTSGTRNTSEALRTARLSRELGYGELIKIGVTGGSKYLLPDSCETTKARELLAKKDFTPLSYIHAGLYATRAMRDAGAAAVMPLAAPIGSNKGLCAKEFIQILLNEINLPIIVDADVGTPARACETMQMGISVVMANTAIAEAKDIALMAKTFSLAMQAGRAGYLAGLASMSGAKASSPLTGLLRG